MTGFDEILILAGAVAILGLVFTLAVMISTAQSGGTARRNDEGRKLSRLAGPVEGG